MYSTVLRNKWFTQCNSITSKVLSSYYDNALVFVISNFQYHHYCLDINLSNKCSQEVSGHRSILSSISYNPIPVHRHILYQSKFHSTEPTTLVQNIVHVVFFPYNVKDAVHSNHQLLVTDL